MNNGGVMETGTETSFLKQNINKAVLVVGGAGYIGSHTAKQLAKNGYTPVVVDRDIKSKPWATQYGPSFEVNLPRDIDHLDQIIKRFNIDSCIHFAAYTKVGESVSDPSKYYLNNVVMTLRLLDKLRSLDVKNFVFSSSAAVYGIPGDGIAKTQDTPKPINPYGKSKMIVEEILKDYNVAYGISSVSLRYFNAAGADKDSEIGELREDETHIVPLAIQAAKHGTEFKLFGTDFDTKDGTCERDYVHVTDLAEAHVLALVLASTNKVCEQFNLGSGINTSNMEIIKAVEKHAGPINVVKSDRRPGDPPCLVADIGDTEIKLNWKPSNSTIDNIVRTAVQWYNKSHKKELQ